MVLRASRFLALIALYVVMGHAVPAWAQLAPYGNTFVIQPGELQGNAAAYDPKNNDFIAVGAWGSVYGRIIRPDGTFATGGFQIDTNGGFAQYADVAYSPDVDSGNGGFLVTWHSNLPTDLHNYVHARLVSATGALLGSEMIVGNEPDLWLMAAHADYSPTSKVFMITWRTAPGSNQIRAARVTPTGTVVDTGSGILVTTTGGERDPSIAYDPDTDNFLIAYSDWIGGAHVLSRLVSASTGAVSGPTLLSSGIATYITQTVFVGAAHQYFVAWNQDNAPGALGRFVNADGTPGSGVIPVSSRVGEYDSIGTAYNPVTQSVLVVGTDVGTYENGGVEVSAAGAILGTSVLTNDGSHQGNYFPQDAASTVEGKWLLTTCYQFQALVGQFVTSTVSGIAPVITQQPASQTVRAGQTVTFTAAASGTPTPSVQWYVTANGGLSWAAIGTNSPTLSFVAHVNDTHKKFLAKFTNSAGTAQTTAATLTVTTPIDFDGQGAEPLVWRPSTGQWLYLSPSGGQSGSNLVWGTAGDTVLPGDIDGDGLTDLIVWRPSTGTWYWLTSSSGYQNGYSKQWGNQALGDIPLLGDIDGDGKADLIVWRGSTGTWFWLPSSSGYAYATQGVLQWGNQSLGDQPLVGDFDGDGKADLAVWRGSTGVWYWLTSSSNYSYQSAQAVWWGDRSLGDVPLVGDIDGDGISDIVIWRGSTGTWWWLTSSTNFSMAGAGSRQWGNQSLGDIPFLSDLDGDGRADLVVWRPGGGIWYWLTSSSNYTAAFSQQFGTTGDIPLMK